MPQGKDTIKFLEGLVVGDIQGVKDGMGTLSVFTNEQGGIIDDTVITKVVARPFISSARPGGPLPACRHQQRIGRVAKASAPSRQSSHSWRRPACNIHAKQGPLETLMNGRITLQTLERM